MFKGRFRDQQYGFFERSLRQDPAPTPDNGQRKRQSINVEQNAKNVDLAPEEKQLAINEDRKKNIFHVDEIRNIMDEILQDKLSNQTYEATTCRLLCMTLSDDIKGRVKCLGMERFRLICNVTIGSNGGQGLFLASRFLWDEVIDNFSTTSFQNSSLFAVAVVFGIFKE